MALLMSDNANKENIPPPFSSSQRASPVTKSPLLPCSKRRVRIPLEDITNLFNYSSLPSTSLPQYRSLSPSTCKFKSAKRRSQLGVDSISTKTQLLLRCKNFR
ncbi:hypothetical protein M5689_008924 [Euphorbia peplus]|nr:hypothetical protein M5689_008924 [Euphorbia peplus]